MRTGDVLLFDLGGVLVEVSSIEGLRRLLRRTLDVDEVRDRLAVCPVLHDFEIGALAPADFAGRFVRAWDLKIPPDEFLKEFRGWPRALLPGARELLASLRPHYRLVALTNSNAVHWERSTDDLGLPQLFDIVFSSHQLGLRKPEPAIYRETLKRLGVLAERVAFFDDLAPNVESARVEGMAAFQVGGIEALTRCLRENGFLPAAA